MIRFSRSGDHNISGGFFTENMVFNTWNECMTYTTPNAFTRTHLGKNPSFLVSLEFAQPSETCSEMCKHFYFIL